MCPNKDIESFINTDQWQITRTIEKTEYGDFFRVEISNGLEVFGVGRARKAMTSFRLALISMEKIIAKEEQKLQLKESR